MKNTEEMPSQEPISKNVLEDLPEQSARKVVQDIIESSMNHTEKLEKISCENSILRCLQKTAKVHDGQLNNFALKTLQSLHQKGENLSKSQMSQAEMAIAILEDDFNKIGKYNLSCGIPEQLDFHSLSLPEKLNYKMQEYARKEISKRAQHLENV